MSTSKATLTSPSVRILFPERGKHRSGAVLYSDGDGDGDDDGGDCNDYDGDGDDGNGDGDDGDCNGDG